MRLKKVREIMLKLKKMCKAVKKGFSADDEEILEQVKNAKYICRKCLRTAADEKYLCRPEKIK